MTVDEEILAQTHATFRFVVDVENERQGAFTECVLPSLEWDVEEVKEGGLNGYPHQLPGRRKAGRLTLKNGVGKSALLEWYLKALKKGEGKTVPRKKVTIKMLDMLLNPIQVWYIQEAYPIKWGSPQLKTSENAIAIQSLEMVCGDISVTIGDKE